MSQAQPFPRAETGKWKCSGEILSNPHCRGDKAFEVISGHPGLQDKGSFSFHWRQVKRVGEVKK